MTTHSRTTTKHRPSARTLTARFVSGWSEGAVIDVDTGEELPLYTPLYVNNVRQPDHGYRPANRRRR
jgi:hypothetical protein